MSFLPKNYTIPENNSNSQYLNPSKLEEGKTTRFRILSKPIIGWQYWTNDNKPVRLKLQDKPTKTPSDIQVRDGKAKINHFWAMIVYNYNTEQLEIFEITQKTIQNQIKNYIDDQDYGDPFNYDFKITRTGAELETKYSLIATPPKDFDKDLKNKVLEKGLHEIQLEKLFDAENPFENLANNQEEEITLDEAIPDMKGQEF